MIKRIACLSTIANANEKLSYSEQVVGMFDSARVYNKEQEIVGVFLVCGDVLLQIIEGDSAKLASAVYRVNRDPRINNVSIVLNEIIEKCSFSRWSLKLINKNCDAHIEYLNKLQRLIGPSLNTQSDTDQFRLDKIFAHPGDIAGSSDAQPPESDTVPNFSGQTLTMKSWPRPTQLRLTAPLMKLCPLLIGHTVSYDRLSTLGLFDSDEELKGHLESLYRAGALQVIVGREKSNVSPLPTAKESPKSRPSSGSGRFSQALRNFIHSHKTKGYSSQ